MIHLDDRQRSLHRFLLALILVANLLIGSLVVRDYGESWDEDRRWKYAELSLAAYTSGKPLKVNEDKGPAYVMLALLGSQALRSLWGTLSEIEAWHFMHFLSFLLAVISLYQICCRMMSRTAALGAVLLFNTQPLLWGHAWINPKDIPFMAFFLASVWLGLRMVTPGGADELVAPSTNGNELIALMRADWRGASSRKRVLVIGAAILILVLLLVLWMANMAIASWIAALVTRLYSEGDASALGRIFERLAENRSSIPADLYAQKGVALYRRLVSVYSILAPILWLAGAAILLPQSRRQFWQGTLRPFIAAAVQSLLNPRLWLAAFFLGFDSAIRTLGPASGMLVAFYGLAKSGRKVIPRLLVYFLLAGVFTVALWPGIWSSPLHGYLKANAKAADFNWGGSLRFMGVEYLPGEQPRSYLPVLFILQFTEPTLILILLGFYLGVRDFLRQKERRPELAMAGFWFLAPFITVMALMPNMYDNFRQFFFIVPALFIFAGLGLQKVFEWTRRLLERSGRATPAMRVAATVFILALVLFPGLYWDLSLHPYQYVYYNQLVGGVGGAFRNYEMEYWSTSYKEAAEYINAHAPAGARIGVFGAEQIIQRYARKDLFIFDFRDPLPDPYYAVTSSRQDRDTVIYPEAPVVFQVSREGAVFTVVKRLDDQVR